MVITSIIASSNPMNISYSNHTSLTKTNLLQLAKDINNKKINILKSFEASDTILGESIYAEVHYNKEDTIYTLRLVANLYDYKIKNEELGNIVAGFRVLETSSTEYLKVQLVHLAFTNRSVDEYITKYNVVEW